MQTEWKICDDVPDASIGYRAIISADGFVVCNPSPMGEKNARLIAAAPNVFSVMRQLLAIARKYENRDVMLDADELIQFIES